MFYQEVLDKKPKEGLNNLGFNYINYLVHFHNKPDDTLILNHKFNLFLPKLDWHILVLDLSKLVLLAILVLLLVLFLKTMQMVWHYIMVLHTSHMVDT